MTDSHVASRSWLVEILPDEVRMRVLVSAACAAALLSAPSDAEVERIEFAAREEVAGGRAFGLAGSYEKLAGTVFFAVDPDHAAHRRIVDLDRAPRDEDGRVRFSFFPFAATQAGTQAAADPRPSLEERLWQEVTAGGGPPGSSLFAPLLEAGAIRVVGADENSAESPTVADERRE